MTTEIVSNHVTNVLHIAPPSKNYKVQQNLLLNYRFCVS